MQTKSISIAEHIELCISKEEVRALLQPENIRAGAPNQKVSELAERVLQGLQIIEEANGRLLEPLDSSEREQMRANLAVMHKTVWSDVSQLRSLGLLELGAD
jgi:hypothetical protein